MKAGKTILFFLAPLLLSFVLHAYLFKYEVVGYHAWRQTQTQTVVYHFSVTNNTILEPQRFDLSSGTSLLLYEFPLYQWLIAQVNRAFGYDISHTRILSFLFFGFMLVGSYLFMRNFFNERVSLLVNACICFSPVLYYYCINPLPDILALAFGFWALNYFFRFLNNKNTLSFFAFALCTCLAVLVKLPYILFGSGIILYLFKNLRKKKYSEVLSKAVIFFVSLIPAMFWYARAWPTWTKNPVGLGMSANTKSLADLFDYFQSNLISSMPELVTNYAAFPFLCYGTFLFFKQKAWYAERVQYMMVVFLTACIYFFYELNLIGRTHDYYLIPFVPFIFLVVAFGIKNLFSSSYSRWVYVLVALTPLLAFLRINHRWNEDPGFNVAFKDLAPEVQRIIPADDTCIVYSDESKYIALYYFKRWGYSMYADELNPQRLEALYELGAKYFITQDKNFDSTAYPGIQFDKLLDKDLKVYLMSVK